MKNLVYLLTLPVFFMAACTQDTKKECHIYGQMQDHSHDGKKIYLVPMFKPDSVGVDSTVIENGRFEFATAKNMMAIVRVELRSRYGLEDLLVVTEPGDVIVTVGRVSRGGGTLQNDSLQKWKEMTFKHRKLLSPYLKRMNDARKSGDSLALKSVKVRIDSLSRIYRHYSQRMAEGVGSGSLREFLNARFPRSYKRKMPDGSVKEIKMD